MRRREQTSMITNIKIFQFSLTSFYLNVSAVILPPFCMGGDELINLMALDVTVHYLGVYLYILGVRQ